MNKNPVKNTKTNVLGRILLLVISLLIVSGDIFAQDYQMTITPRRLGHQLGAEIWIKTLESGVAPISDISVHITYNRDFLEIRTGDGNQPSTKTDAVYNNPDMPPTSTSPALPYYVIESDMSNINGYRPLAASVATGVYENIASLHARLDQPTSGGIYPDDEGRGTFIGMLRFTIKNGVVLTDASMTGFAFYNGVLGTCEVLDGSYDRNNVTDLVEFVEPEPFCVRGITVLNPTEYQTVNRYPAVPYASMGENYGYPIYFERSGLLEPDILKGVYGTPRYAYQISYSLNNGMTYLETGRVAESRMKNAAMSTDAVRNSIYSGMVDYFSNTLDYYITTGSGKVIPTDVASGLDLIDQPDGPGIDTLGYGGVLRVIWKADENFSYRSEEAKVKITMLKDTTGTNVPLNQLVRPASTEPTRSGESVTPFVLGRIFFAQLSGPCQYLRSERNFSTPSFYTVGAWINLNRDNGEGSEPGIIATSSGSKGDAVGGGWMLYLRDGIYPAFRVRADEPIDGNDWLADIVSNQPISLYDYVVDGRVVITDAFSRNWTHVAATVASNVVTLFVDGEQVAQAIVPGASSRPFKSQQPIWVGVNPDRNFEPDIDFLFAGLKEVQVWKTALTQDQLRQYISGIPSPTRATADTNYPVGTDKEGFDNDPKYSLSIYANLQGIISDIATEGLVQDYTNNLNYFTYCDDASSSVNNEVIFRPDGSHIKLTSPSCGEGVSNLKGRLYEVRWTAYGIGNLFASKTGEPGDVTIQLSRDGGQNWFDAIGPQKYDSATGGTFAVSLDNEEVELAKAIWEPYNNITLTSIANDIQGLLGIENNYQKIVRLRITGNADRGQDDIYAESDDFIVAPHFALVNTPTAQITIPEGQALNITTQNAFLEAWINPYDFPTEGVGNGTFPIIVKKDPETGDLHYALRLLPTGQLQFEFANYDSASNTRDYRIAVSDPDPRKCLSAPNSIIYDSIWYHVGVYLNIPNNGTQSSITFFIDGLPQTEIAIRNQLGEGIVTDAKNTFPTYLGYEPNNGGEGGTYFDGAMKEFRFWRNNPGGASQYNTVTVNDIPTNELYNFIQGASTVRANELIQVGTTNYAQGLVAAYIMDGGSWVNNGADGTILSYPDDITLMARTNASCGDRKYAATYPYIKLVEPYANQKVGNDETIRVRWVGFDYNRNDLVSFTAGYASRGHAEGHRADLGISDGAGGGSWNDFYPAVASMFENTSFTNSMLLIEKVNPYEFQGTKSKSQYAALLDMSIANSDVKNNKSYDEQGKVPSVQTNGRLQLFARANINSPDPLEYANGENGKDGLIKTLMSESPVFSITPPSNFTVRVLLEGYHKGLDSGIVGILGTDYESNGLNIRLYTNEGGMPGNYVPNSTISNKSSYSAESRNIANRGRDKNNFANVPFTLDAVIDGNYFVVVDNLNYLSMMSAFAANFRFAGDLDTTWAVESGWDFQSWNGVEGNSMTVNDDITNPMGTMSTYQIDVPTADRNSILGTWTLTALNFTDGQATRNHLSPKALPAMVGGDIVKDGVIDVLDYQAIRDNAMSYNPRYSLRGYGEPANNVDRTIVDFNLGKVSTLYSLPNIYADIYPETPEGGLIGVDDVADRNSKIDIINTDAAAKRNAKIQETFEAGIDYVVKARPFVNDNYVDVPVYIQNLGDVWAMANSSFPIEYDPTVLSFNGLIQTQGVLFANNNVAGYNSSYYAPSQSAIDPVPNTYSIEINFDAEPALNRPGINVPNNETYLGTLRFNLLRNDESIFFRWSKYGGVLSVDGRDLKGDGTFEEIPPIIVNKTIEFVSPYCAELLDGGSTTTISWKTPIMSRLVNLEYSSDNGNNWTLITKNNPIQITTGTFLWTTPFINSNICVIRIVDAATREELAKSCIFKINIAPSEITRPSSADPTYIAGAKEYIKWICYEAINVYFEFSENGINGWTKVTDVVNASLTQTLWTVANANTCGGVIRMVNAQTGTIVAVSEPFKVGAGSVNITSPKKDDKFNSSNPNITIDWTYKQVNEFTLEYTADGGANWNVIAKNVKASARRYNWKPTDVKSTNVIVRAINTQNECVEYGRTSIFSIGSLSVESDAEGAIVSITPNPVNDEANIKFAVEKSGNATIAIFDVQGNKVLDLINNEFIEIGTHELGFNVNKLASGVYVVRMQIGSANIIKEFVVIK
ncbi:MAG: T9SS type A sorting domain-containing protein [Bacteroidetes bacterium]|nr:T9SS type A sorting domain-containing protein [Bacteroidota bacterium]